MIEQHSSLKLLYGFEPCFAETKAGFREYENIFETRVGNYGELFKNRKMTLEQKNDFWRHFSQRIWSYDDFSFRFAPAAASLLTGALRYKIWYNPLGVYELLLSAIIFPYALNDLDTKITGKENRGVADLLKQIWFIEQLKHFEEHGKFSKEIPDKVNKHEILDQDFYVLLKECEKIGTWTEQAWKYHCNLLVTNEYYHNNSVAIMQHEMLHIMWEHLVRLGDRDIRLHNIATDYAINQTLSFSPEVRKMLITDDNEEYFDRFVIGISLWRANQSTKDQKTLESYGLNLNSKVPAFKPHVKKLADDFVYETTKGIFGRFHSRKNIYLGKDSDFYYDVLEYVQDDIEENGQNGTLDDHSMWSKNDDQQQQDRGDSGQGSGDSDSSDSDRSENGDENGSGSESDGQDEGSSGDQQKGSSQSSDASKGSAKGTKDKDDASVGQDDPDAESKAKKEPASNGPTVSSAKKAVDAREGVSESEADSEGNEPAGSKDTGSGEQHHAKDGDVVSLGGDERGNMRGGYEHPGFKDIIGKQEAMNNFKVAAEKSGYNPDDPEDLERALNDIPGLAPLRQMFHEWFGVKTKNWRKELRAFLRHCSNPTALEYTMTREHRALDDTFPGKKRDIGFELVIGLDTSGSISFQDFNDFMGQINKMARDCDFDKVRIIQCHSRIADDNVYRVRSAQKLKEFCIVETGGTKMQPVFERLKREGNKKPLILFTDGYIDDFMADEYKTFKHIMFLSRGNSGQKAKLESHGFKVLCQDDESVAA